MGYTPTMEKPNNNGVVRLTAKAGCYG